MSDQINELKQVWKNAKNAKKGNIDTDKLIAQANLVSKKNKRLKWGTIIILTITLIGISAFFKYVAGFKETISHVGIILMTGGLVVRILVEIYSVYLHAQIEVTETAFTNTSKLETFHRFRKKIHGTFTVTILIMYTAGFYLLTPEFSNYFSTTMMVLIDLSYLLGAAIFLTFIRKGIKDEMQNLDVILSIKKKFDIDS